MRTVSLSRRALLRASAASAAAALAAACSPSQSAGPTVARAGGSGPPASGSAAESPAPSSAASSSTGTAASVVRHSVEVRHGPRTSHKVALTFHGAGDSALAETLLGRLEARKVQATVMAVGTWLQAEPAMAKRILRGGHDLGNHTLHHYPMRGLSAASANAEVEGGARALRRTSGSRGTFFRASGTQVTTPTIRSAAARAGYDRCISYDVDGLDWQDPSSATVVRAVLDGAQGGSIISLHLGHHVTISALPGILSGLTKAGLRPVTLTELLA